MRRTINSEEADIVKRTEALTKKQDILSSKIEIRREALVLTDTEEIAALGLWAVRA